MFLIITFHPWKEDVSKNILPTLWMFSFVEMSCLPLFFFGDTWVSFGYYGKPKKKKSYWPLHTLKRSGQARSKGRALWFLVSKHNLNTSSWCIWCTHFFQKQIKNKRVTVSPKVEAVKNWKETNHTTLESQFLSTPKILCMLLCCYYSSKMICRSKGGTPIAH
jgi:hypothetical protein